ncbi:hypothetical protein CsSME_00033854 [Camellia sinensis var. sinensis]
MLLIIYTIPNGILNSNHKVEAESLRHLSAKYCPLLPPPRSTIAAAFSPDGKTIASTQCLKVLSGHRRTPWVVRFHPLYPEIIASGSLDHEVRLWDANTAECIGSHDFCNYFSVSISEFVNFVPPCRPSHCIYCFPCPRGSFGCSFRPQAIYMALQQKRGHFFTNHCTEDTPFASGSAFSSICCPISVNCRGQ